MAQAQLLEPFSVAVEHSLDSEALNEPLQLSRRRSAFGKVHEVRLHASLREESKSFPRVGAFFHPEDLHFHGFGERVCAVSASREYRYDAPWWLRNAHAQTIWGRFFKRVRRIATTCEMLQAPDGEALELHHLDAPAGAPRVLLLHGLEGSRDSHYIDGMLAHAAERRWGATLLVFRGCGTAPNAAARFYHSGETTDLDFVFRALSDRGQNIWFIAGVSLGGNVLLKWLGENGDVSRLKAAVAISTPFDLQAGSAHISRGLSRVYDRNFVRSLRRKALAKLNSHPDLVDATRVRHARTIFEFDDAVTAPVHGFADARDYYTKSSALGFLERIRVPTLLISSRDDPFLPATILDRVNTEARRNPALVTEFHDTGGHVGFVGGTPRRPFYYAEWRTFRFFDDVLEQENGSGYD
jgi:predicted alpha/beta-fold hydrolase